MLPQTAAPHVVSLGIQDNSTRALPVEPIAGAPDHTPVFYLLTSKGPEEALVDGGRRAALFGSESFVEGSKYFTHQTFGSNLAAAGANLQKIRRVKPDNAGPRANVTLYLDIVEKQVQSYERNADGSIKRDPITGAAIAKAGGATYDGYQVGIVAQVDSSATADDDFGKASIKSGSTVVGGATSQLYPLMSFRASSWGEVFHLSGLRIATVDPIDTRARHTKAGQQLYRLLTVRKPDAKSSSTVVKSIYAATDAWFSLDDSYKDPDTASSMSLATALSNWDNTTNLSLPYTVGDISEVKTYKASIEAALQMLYTAEQIAVAAEFPLGVDAAFTDVSTTEDLPYLINPFTARTTTNVPYYAIQLGNGMDGTTAVANAVTIGQSSDIMLGGSSDGTITLEQYETKVVADIQNYLDQNSIYQNPLLMEESVFYDTGFSFSNKLKLAAFIGAPLRKDLAVYVSNYVYGEEKLTEAERIGRTTSLVGVIRAFSESTYYGTPTCRGWLVDGAGRSNNFNYAGRLPLTLDLLIKNCKVFSAQNRVWKQAEIYDSYPSNKITAFYDLTTRFVPPATRNKLWDNGVTYPQAYSSTEDHFPAVRSVYSNDTSILTNSYAVWAAISLERLGFKAHATFTGNVRYTNLQFIEAVTKFCERDINGRFAGLATVVPKCIITEGDATLGYSWHLELHYSANNMKTAMVLSKHAYRTGDIPQ
jgi:hypothetical protein